MIEEYIDSLYSQLYSERKYDIKSQILYTIVLIKCEKGIQDYINSAYLDIKKFVYFYLKSKEVRDYGYDEYNPEIIKKVLLYLPLSQRKKMLQYTKRVLKKNHEDTEWVEDILGAVRMELYKEKHNVIMWLLYYGTNNSLRMFFSIIIILLFTYVFLLPSFIPFFELFAIEYVDISCNFYANHFFNIFSLFFCLDLGTKITCLNGFAVLLYSLIKLSYIILVTNFLYRKLSSKIFIDEEYS